MDNRFLNEPSGVKETILHEIAHALLGPRYRVHGGHGPKFSRLARKLGCSSWTSVGQYEFSWREKGTLDWHNKDEWTFPGPDEWARRIAEGT